MLKGIDNCIDPVSGCNISFSKSESGIKFTLQSKTGSKFNCKVIDVDNCVFGGAQIRRCDWLFVATDERKAFYVELKGVNIDEASEQIYNAINRTKAQIPNFEIEARVVSAKGQQPEILNSEYYRKVKRIIKKDIEFCKVHKKNRFTHVENI